MINVSVSQLVNQVDKTNFTLYAEWEDTHFKIILLRPCTIPLSGEVYNLINIYLFDCILLVHITKLDTKILKNSNKFFIFKTKYYS